VKPTPAAGLAPATFFQTPWGLAALALPLGTLAAWWVLDWHPLGQPLDLLADSLHAATLVRTIQDTGWYTNNPRLGAPGTMQLLDFPMADNGHFLIIRLLALVIRSTYATINVYFLLSFGLCAGSAAYVLRRCGCEPAAALCGALIYGLLPYHFASGVAHLWLSNYVGVPWAIYVVLSTTQILPETSRLSARQAAGVAAVLPAFGTYYTFFTCYVLGVCLLLEHWAMRRPWRACRAGLWSLGASIGGLLLNLLPAIVHRWRSTDVPSLTRPLVDTEVYALKLVQMLLPLQGHRQPWLEAFTNVYNRAAPLVNENRYASMGLGLSLLFLWSAAAGIGALWGSNPAETSSETAAARWAKAANRQIVFLSLACFVYATIGGISAIVGFYISAKVRAALRIVVFMHFFSILGAAWLWTGCVRPRLGKGLSTALLLGLLGLTLWDQGDIDYFPQRPAFAALEAADTQFFSRLDAAMAPSAQILELPYVRFPEGGFGPQDYFLMRPYLHTQHGHYTFGAMTGSAADKLSHSLADLLYLDPERLIGRLKDARFTGVLLSRAIPSRERQPIEPALRRVLGAPRLVSSSGEWIYWSVPE
jgi:hypothetical protein